MKTIWTKKSVKYQNIIINKRRVEQTYKNNEDEEIVPRTVTVVEHEQGFKSSGLARNKVQLSTKSSQNNDEPLLMSSEKGSFKEISEKSKPLSPMTSQRLSPKDQAFDYIPDSEKLVDKPSSSSKKNIVKFKEEGYGEDEGILPPASSHSRSSNIIDKNNTVSSRGDKNSSTKIVSILKNSRQGKLSTSIKDDNSEISNRNNDNSKNDSNYLNVTGETGKKNK